MVSLNNTTFIIPVMVESQDRYNNAISVLGFLNHHFETNVIIHEMIDEKSKLDFLSTLTNLKIKHITEKFNGCYHRTRQLNEMLDITETPVVVNYDIDVLLPVDSYVNAQNAILNDKLDIVYPYQEGRFQKRIFQSFNRNAFNKSFDLGLLNDNDFDYWNARQGHCMFLNTEKYISCGGENEHFIAYGPEDSERYDRFHKIGYRVGRVNDFILHFEHARTSTSNNSNEFFVKNNNLYKLLSKLSKDDLLNYYDNIDYKEKYNKFKKNIEL